MKSHSILPSPRRVSRWSGENNKNPAENRNKTREQTRMKINRIGSTERANEGHTENIRRRRQRLGSTERANEGHTENIRRRRQRQPSALLLLRTRRGTHKRCDVGRRDHSLHPEANEIGTPP
ncbi:hypothetical protein QE152_g9324 [Popillia japonica]|uniref:Uncharacterized protein n=1 Tax=Popillia japonica TaxID=7064 RepID=A0AAW1LXT9_POPJA